MSEGVPVVARGAGTSLAGGALTVRGCGCAGPVPACRRFSKSISQIASRAFRPASPTSAISDAVSHEEFFYAPDPSSQMACTIGGNIAMNSGGAHCLKYGVTTNNVLGVKMVLIDGTVVEFGGEHLDAGGL
jgi:glycolate oxidase